MAYGLTGAFIAWVFVIVFMLGLQSAATNLATLYQTSFALSTLSFFNGLWLLIGGAALGIGGAWLTVNRQIALFEPK